MSRSLEYTLRPIQTGRCRHSPRALNKNTRRQLPLTPQQNLKYRPDIDGLRAVAVLPVVFYHAGIELFSGGFVGVDVFFVISGYLITSIIAGEIDAGGFRFRNFYERRARRLFPALFTVLGFTCIATPFLLMPEELEDFGQSVATTALFTSNFLFFSEAGYFAGPAEAKPLLHTWSLAIEEQYYLLFPGLLILIREYASRRYVGWIMALFAASLAISIWSVAYAPDAAFYLLPSRTWELLLGSLLALTSFRIEHRWGRELGSLAGIALIAIAIFGFSSETAFPGAAALLPCVGTALIIACGACGPQSELTVVTRLLSLRAVVFCGLISYSLYLWHWPILVLAKHYLLRPLDATETALLIAAAIGVSILSWRFVEKPFRGRDGLFDGRGMLRFSLALMIGAIAVGLVYDETEGLPERLPAEVARIADVANDKPSERRRCEGIAPEEISYERVCRVNELDTPPSFAVWGDSHAMAVMPTIGEVAAAAGRNGLNFTSNGCAPILNVSRPVRDLRGECPAFNGKVLSILREHPELETIVIVARWARHGEGTPYGEESRSALFLATADALAETVEENRIIYRRELFNTLEQLMPLNRNIVIVGPIPEMGVDVPIVLAKATWREQPKDLSVSIDAYLARQAFVNDTFEQAADRFNIHYHDPSPYFCQDNRCADVTQDGLPLYFDNNHVASRGAQRLTPLFERILSEATRSEAIR